MPIRVLVCGGRDYGDKVRVHEVLGAIDAKNHISVLIHGAARGADSLAGGWAMANGITENLFPADWDKYGKKAGAIRNALMLKVGRPDLVVAFPGGRGTRMMVDMARKAKVWVMEVS